MTVILPDPARAGALLTIDLGAIQHNYRLLQGRMSGGVCGGVVKADAYGLGAAQVAPALAAAGCRHFFVAHLEEGIALRAVLPDAPGIVIMHGLPPGTEAECREHRLIPVLNSRRQLDAWAGLCRAVGRREPAVLQVDTGMARLGLSADELDAVADDPACLAPLSLVAVMSHLACAEDHGNPANDAQLARFRDARHRLPPAPASFANSSGIFLGDAYQFDIARPGAALYGVAPVAGAENPMRPVVRLQGKVIQTRTVPAGTPVGYGGTHRTAAPTRIATVSVGYADGFLRSQSNRAVVHVGAESGAESGAVALPVLGRVSMDTITVDASALPDLADGTLVDLLGPHRGVDAAAEEAGTIGYEILTSLGRRYARHYVM